MIVFYLLSGLMMPTARLLRGEFGPSTTGKSAVVVGSRTTAGTAPAAVESGYGFDRLRPGVLKAFDEAL